MKKHLFLLTALLCCALLAGCRSQVPFDLGDTTRLELESAGGAAVSVVEAADVQRIVDNLLSLKLKKQAYSEPSVLAYTLTCYDAANAPLAKLTVPLGESRLGFGGYDYAITGGSLDIDFWDELLSSAEPPADAATVGYFYQGSGLTLEIPADWEYAVEAYKPDGYGFGIRFFPAGQEGGVSLLYYSGIFSVCGTGLKTQDIDLGNGLTGSMGIYDNNEIWSFIRFAGGSSGDYAAQTNEVSGWWEEHGSKAMYILSTARMGEDVLTENKFLAAAMEAATIEYDTIRCVLDPESGTYTVDFSHSGWASGGQTVYLDPQGSVLRSEYGE